MTVEEIKLYPVADTVNPTDKVIVQREGKLLPEAATVSSLIAATLAGLPTTDPGVEGEIWNNAGVISVSAG